MLHYFDLELEDDEAIDFIALLRAGMERYRKQHEFKDLINQLEDWCEETEDAIDE